MKFVISILRYPRKHLRTGSDRGAPWIPVGSGVVGGLDSMRKWQKLPSRMTENEEFRQLMLSRGGKQEFARTRLTRIMTES